MFGILFLGDNTLTASVKVTPPKRNFTFLEKKIVGKLHFFGIRSMVIRNFPKKNQIQLFFLELEINLLLHWEFDTLCQDISQKKNTIKKQDSIEKLSLLINIENLQSLTPQKMQKTLFIFVVGTPFPLMLQVCFRSSKPKSKTLDLQ